MLVSNVHKEMNMEKWLTVNVFEWDGRAERCCSVRLWSPMALEP